MRAVWLALPLLLGGHLVLVLIAVRTEDQMVQQSLQGKLDQSVDNLSAWITGQLQTAQVWSCDGDLWQVFSDGETEHQVRGHGFDGIVNRLNLLCQDRGYAGYLLLSPHADVRANSLKGSTGQQSLSQLPVRYKERIQKGEPVFVPPFDVTSSGAKDETGTPPRLVILCTFPVRNPKHEVVGHLGFWISPDGEFSRVLQGSNDPSRMTETYAVDGEGRLVSTVNRTDQGGGTGSLSLIPGLTQLAWLGRALRRRGMGVQTGPYQGLYGESAVGAWRWLPQWNLGVIHEEDASVTLATFNRLKWLLCFELLITVVVICNYGWVRYPGRPTTSPAALVEMTGVSTSARHESSIEQLADHLPAVIFRVIERGPEDYQLQYVSRGVERYIPVTCEELLKNPKLLLDFVYPADAKLLVMTLAKSLRERTAWNFEGRLAANGEVGTFWFRGEWRPMSTSNGQPVYCGMMWDISNLKRDEAVIVKYAQEVEIARGRADDQAMQLALQAEELTSIRQQVEQAFRAKSEFLTNMSHEIRTPMTAIMGYLEVIQNETQNNAGVNDAVHTIRQNAENLLWLIDNLLDLANLESKQTGISISHVPLLPILKDVADGMQIALPKTKQLHFCIECPNPLPEIIESDPLRLKQLLKHLLHNAIKFTEAGVIRLRITPARLENGECWLEFEVIDTGIGMSQDQIQRAFEPFYQSDSSLTRRYGGIGLGLGICHRVVTLLGGTIQFESQLGAGSRVSFRIPVGDTRNTRFVNGLEYCIATNLLYGETQSSVPAPKLRVLLVEDGVDNQRVISYVLKKGGIEVDVADNGQIGVDKALEALAVGTPYQVILMDMQMPVMDGYQATRILKDSHYPAAIIAVTAHTLSGDREKCLLAGCDEYLPKPIEREQLLKVVRYFGNHVPTTA
ncbi:MAG: ATP-binding protein [Planctomycetales bacterium]